MRLVHRSSRQVIAAAAVAITIAACGTTLPQSAPGTTRSDRTDRTNGADASEAAPNLRRPAHTEADTRFMQGMIAHHAQALVMTSLVPERTNNEDIHLLAERIEVSQRDEIASMQRWLRHRGEEVPSPDTTMHGMHGDMAGDQPMMPGMSSAAGQEMLMPGMLTAQELHRLAQAQGREFDRLFLEFMIRHHEGALTMVGDLFATRGAAQETEVFRFASEVDSGQRMEIRRMRALLDDLR